MKRHFSFLLLLLLFGISLQAQEQTLRRKELFSASKQNGHILQPSESLDIELDIPLEEIPFKRTLRVVGGGVMPGRFSPRGEEFFRQQEGLIDDNLDSLHVWKDKYSLYFKGDTDDFERHAYFRIPGQRLREGFSVAFKRKNLKVAPDGDFGVELHLYFAKEGRYEQDVYDEPDSLLFFPIPQGSGNFRLMKSSLKLPQKVKTILVRIGGTRFAGECWVEAPSCCDPFVPSEQKVDPIHYWVGVNMTSRSWPKWKLEWNGKPIFEGNIFDRSSNVADFYIPLPESLKGKGTLRLILEKEPYRKAYPYQVQSVQLLERSARAFEIGAVPQYVSVGDTTAVLIETYSANLSIEADGNDAIQWLDQTLKTNEPGIYPLSFVAMQPATNITFCLSAGSRSASSSIAQFVVKKKDDVLLSSGDEVYIDKQQEPYTPFFLWYFQNRVGNAYQFRPSYQWSGVRRTEASIMQPYLNALKQMRVPYAWQVEGRTLASREINLPLGALQSPVFRGKQAHENDGGYYYWQHFKYIGLYSDMAARARPFGGIFAKHRPIYTPYGVFIHYDPYIVEDMADGANRFVANLSYSRGESTRHTGPSTLFRYLYRAGYDWLGAEQMYGPEEVVLSSLRGASRAYGKSSFGSLHAMQWGSGPFTDPKHSLRLYLSLAVAYMHGSSHMNTEEALWTDEHSNDRFSESGKQHLYAQNRMLDFIQTHSRRGNLHTKMAVVQGRNDAWKCFGRTSIWSQEDEKWAFNTAMESFDLLQVYYPQSRLTYCSKEGLFTQTPYGPVDLVPIEAPQSVLNSYKSIVFLGWNTFDNEDFIKLIKYVRQGGTLLLTAAHLNSELQPHLPARFPKDDTVIKMLLGDDYLSLSERTVHRLGQGCVIYYPQNTYPAASEVRDSYQADMKVISDTICEQEYQKGWVASSKHIGFTVWDEGLLRTIYLLNVDWQSEESSHLAWIKLGDRTFTLQVPRYSIATLRCKENYAAILKENTSDVLDIIQDGAQILVVCQTVGPDTLTVYNGSSGTQEEYLISHAGLHRMVIR